MKKILLGVVAIAALASYNIYRSNNETENMSDTMLANVEALAAGENGNYTGLIYLNGEYGTGGCISCAEPKDSNCTCR